MAPPRFIKLLGFDTKVKDAAALKFLGMDGHQYTAIIDPIAIPAVIGTLLILGGKIGAGRPKGKGVPATVQPLIPTGFETGNTEAGEPVLYFHFGNHGALPIELTHSRLLDVEAKVSELVRRMKPQPPGKKVN